MVEMLLDSGADANQTNSDGETALYFAAQVVVDKQIVTRFILINLFFQKGKLTKNTTFKSGGPSRCCSYTSSCES